jgi:hypothetical protein
MANLECQHFPDVGKQHAHTCSAFARLRLGSSCGAHKWYQYPRVTRTGHLKAVLGGSDWLPSPTHRPPRLTGEKIRSTYKGAPFCSLVMRRVAQLDTEDRVYGLLTPKVANALGSRGVNHRFRRAKDLIFWNVTPGQTIVSAWNSHQHSTGNSRRNAAA